MIASLKYETESQLMYKGLLKTLESILKDFDKFICSIINTIVGVAPFIKGHDKKKMTIETFFQKEKKKKVYHLPDGKGGITHVEIV